VTVDGGLPDLTGKVAVVTGAGRGLGREIAVALARCGADLALIGRTYADLVGTAALIAEQPDSRTLTVRADVSVPDDVSAARSLVEQELGAAGVLVNAAGVFGPVAPLVDCSPEEWIATLMVDAVGPYLTCHAFVPAMIRAGWGRVVNLSSAGALLPPVPYNSAYSTAKAALNRLTRQLAIELEGTGVSANVMHPGSLKTEMWQDIRDQAARLPDRGGPLGDWVELVEKTGGDSSDEAVALVLGLIRAPAEVNGEFHWPPGAHQTPVPSW
jgi:NAD(P)-dependent dehydrogenase (short-subunit alcohol dehydrogenase family)